MRLLLATLVAIVWSGCVSDSRVAPGPTQENTAHAQRFDRVERLVRTRYYARDFNGVAWTELRTRFRPLAANAGNDAAWYQTVNEMLRELRDAHTRAHAPDAHRSRMVRDDGGTAPWQPGNTTQVWPDGVVYLRLGRFDRANLRWLTREIDAHPRAPGMILDLRYNPGGLVTCTQRAVGLFFSERVTMGWVISRDGRRTVERSRPTTHRPFLAPLVVLVGPESHSSAEVFAYVMQHHARAAVIGQRTAGQVLGARPYRLPDGGQLYVSVSDFRRFDGSRLEGEGVQPDLVVAAAATEIAGEFSQDPAEDPTVLAALLALRVRMSPTPATPARE